MHVRQTLRLAEVRKIGMLRSHITLMGHGKDLIKEGINICFRVSGFRVSKSNVDTPKYLNFFNFTNLPHSIPF
jgi:hypothetical protein